MDIESRLRYRFEATLLDAKRKVETGETAGECFSPQHDPGQEERNLHEQIIRIYRGAVSDVNQRLQDNINFTSSLSRIFESIREKENFQEICFRIVDCVLQDVRVEYCGMIFFKGPEQAEDPVSLEGFREERRFLRIHSNSALLGSPEFEATVVRLASEAPGTVSVDDVCLDLRFSDVDLPSVVRSLACVPLILNSSMIGVLVLSHSRPHFFQPSLIQILEILANTISHLRLLLGKCSAPAESAQVLQTPNLNHQVRDFISIVLFHFDLTDGHGRNTAMEKARLQAIRSALDPTLEGKESLLFQGGAELLALLPGVSAEQLPHRVMRMWEAFDQWKKSQQGSLRNARLSLGFSTCEEGQNLARALEIASLMMHPEPDGSLSVSATTA